MTTLQEHVRDAVQKHYESDSVKVHIVKRNYPPLADIKIKRSDKQSNDLNRYV